MSYMSLYVRTDKPGNVFAIGAVVCNERGETVRRFSGRSPVRSLRFCWSGTNTADANLAELEQIPQTHDSLEELQAEFWQFYAQYWRLVREVVTSANCFKDVVTFFYDSKEMDQAFTSPPKFVDLFYYAERIPGGGDPDGASGYCSKLISACKPGAINELTKEFADQGGERNPLREALLFGMGYPLMVKLLPV